MSAMSSHERDRFLEYLVEMLAWLCEVPGGSHVSKYPGMTEHNIKCWESEPVPIIFPEGFLQAPRVQIGTHYGDDTYHSMDLRLSLEWLVQREYISAFEAQRLTVHIQVLESESPPP